MVVARIRRPAWRRVAASLLRGPVCWRRLWLVAAPWNHKLLEQVAVVAAEATAAVEDGSSRPDEDPVEVEEGTSVVAVVVVAAALVVAAWDTADSVPVAPCW